MKSFLMLFAGLIATAVASFSPEYEYEDKVLNSQRVSSPFEFPTNSIPKGVVSMIGGDAIHSFSATGEGSGEYKGWYICDGRNGTPDLRGRVPVGVDPTNSSDYNQMSLTGGSESVTLTDNHIPKHSHDINLNSDTNGNHFHKGSSYRYHFSSFTACSSTYTSVYQSINLRTSKSETVNDQNHSHKVSGRSGTHGFDAPLPKENRQPFIVVAYVIYLGELEILGHETTEENLTSMNVTTDENLTSMNETTDENLTSMNETTDENLTSMNETTEFNLNDENKVASKNATKTILPDGTVLMFATDNINKFFDLDGKGIGDYEGWRICDGRNGTPDLRGRVPAGADLTRSVSDFHKIHATGGSDSVTLTDRHIPKHSHDVNLGSSDEADHSHKFDMQSTTFVKDDRIVPRTQTIWKHCFQIIRENIPALISIKTTESGDHLHNLKGKTEPNIPGAPSHIDNRQPYFVVTYIIFNKPTSQDEENSEVEQKFPENSSFPIISPGKFHVLPRQTIIMIANDHIREYFNLMGKGVKDYKGWYICDGRNGTPDLRGRVPVGVDLENPRSDFNKILSTGGTEFVTLTEKNLPKHSHEINLNTDSKGAHSHTVTYFSYQNMKTRNASPGSYSAIVPSKTRTSTNSNSTSKGGQHYHSVSGKTSTEGFAVTAALDNRQPYYVLAFIIYLG